MANQNVFEGCEYDKELEKYIDRRYPVRMTIPEDEVQRLSLLNIGRTLTGEEMQRLAWSMFDTDVFAEVCMSTIDVIEEITGERKTKCYEL